MLYYVYKVIFSRGFKFNLVCTTDDKDNATKLIDDADKDSHLIMTKQKLTDYYYDKPTLSNDIRHQLTLSLTESELDELYELTWNLRPLGFVVAAPVEELLSIVQEPEPDLFTVWYTDHITNRPEQLCHGTTLTECIIKAKDYQNDGWNLGEFIEIRKDKTPIFNVPVKDL